MAIEEQTIRYYTDVLEAFDPSCVAWSGIGEHSPLPPECMAGYKRIWIEVRMPSDRTLWADRFEGFSISGVDQRTGQRNIQIDNVETGTREPEPTRPRPARRSRRIDSEVAEESD